MYSFYGGREGGTWELKKTFTSVEAMVEAFSGGGGYTDVKYNEYVLIAPTRSETDRTTAGYVYRRGFNYSDEKDTTAEDYDVKDPGAGAIYVGVVPGVASMYSQGDSIYVTYTGSTDSVYLGRTSGGVHIYGIYESVDDLPEGGFTGTHEGWIAIVGTGDSGDFYVYDKNTDAWVETTILQKYAADPEAVMTVSAASTDDANIPAVGSPIEGGYWFVIE